MNIKQFSLARLFTGIFLVSFIVLAFTGCSAEEEDTGPADLGNGIPPATSNAKPLDTNCANQTINLGGASSEIGGQLYDKWWATRAFAVEPTTEQSVWAERASPSSNIRPVADTWRCKECHGWDYKGKDGAYGTGGHYTGFPGILAASTNNKSATDIYCMIRSGTESFSNHKFSNEFQTGALTNFEIIHLVKFITDPNNNTGLIDTNLYIEPVSKTPVSGSISIGKTTYEQECSSSGCHGSDGNAQSGFNVGAEALGEMADSNPWEFLHKFRYGHPGEGSMPRFAFEIPPYTPSDGVDVIAYAQDALYNPSEGSGTGTGTGTTTSNKMVLGGLLYDNWPAIKNKTSLPDNPVWALRDFSLTNSTTANNRTGVDTWRCKECHGWDYKGRDGYYGPGSGHYTRFKGLLPAALSSVKTEAVIRDTITNGFPLIGSLSQVVHNYGQPQLGMPAQLTATEIDALVHFIKNGGIIDTNTYINEDKADTNNYKTALGNATNENAGMDIYISPRAGGCYVCHGTDGKLINFNAGSTPPEYLGDLARSNPWEVLHKTRFGQPNTNMPSLLDFDLTVRDAANVLLYAQGVDLP